MNKFYVEKRTSKKGKTYIALFCNNGSKEFAVTFDRIVLMRLLDYKLTDFDNMEVGKPVEVK